MPSELKFNRTVHIYVRREREIYMQRSKHHNRIDLIETIATADGIKRWHN